MSSVVVKTPPCRLCRNTSLIMVDEERMGLFLGGMMVQEAFPTLDADERELLISGTHAHCWVALHGTEDGE